jgi:hypothetical protein
MQQVGSWRRLVCVAAFGLACATAASSLSAQELAPGARVRMNSPQLRRQVVATIMSRTHDSIIIAVPLRGRRPDSARASLQSVALTDIGRIDVSRGHSRGTGAYRGFLTGALLGAAISSAILVDINSNPREGAEIGFVIALVLPPAVSILGSAVGFLIGAENWVRLSP